MDRKTVHDFFDGRNFPYLNCEHMVNGFYSEYDIATALPDLSESKRQEFQAYVDDGAKRAGDEAVAWRNADAALHYAYRWSVCYSLREMIALKGANILRDGESAVHKEAEQIVTSVNIVADWFIREWKKTL